MKKFLLPALVTSLLITSPAFSEQAPVSYADDLRIKHFAYDQNNVYKLELFMKSVTAIQFAEGEDVQSILIGDSASWEVVKLRAGNIVSIKPLIDTALTDMTIYTDRHVYTFELHAKGEIKPGPMSGQNMSFRAAFTYPDDMNKAADDSLVVGGPVDQNYMVSGLASFRPLAVEDNTLQTTFYLKTGSPRPAIFKVGPDKKERLVNSRTNKDRIIIDGTSDFWVMRIGDEKVCVGRARSIRNSLKIGKVRRHG
jgi:type IV secretion system protein VirB9